MIRMPVLFLILILAAILPLFAEELHVSVFTPAQGDAAAFRKLVASSVISAPAGQLERLKGAFVLTKPKATPPVSLLTDSLAGKRVESGHCGNLNTLAFTDSSVRRLQILVWNTGSTRNFAELVIPDAGRFFGKERVDMRLKLLTTDESEEQPSTNRGDYAILNGALSFPPTRRPGTMPHMSVTRERKRRFLLPNAPGMSSTIPISGGSASPA